MKKLLLALLIILGLISCEREKTFKISVNLDNSTGKTVYLQKYDNQEMKTIDSLVANDNKAVFVVKQNGNTEIYNVIMKGWRRPLVVFTDNQDVTITGDCQKYKGINVLASETQEKLNTFNEEVGKIEDDQEIHDYVLGFVEQNIDNPISAYALYQYKWAFTLDELEVLNELVEICGKSAYSDMTGKYVQDLQKTNPGKPFIDFTQKDVNGEDFTLSEIIGTSKVIILDFWASWCPDCRKENPNLVALYEQYKEKGLDIVSVSLDTDEAAWKKAIDDDKLSWSHHVSDLKGWKNEVAQMYTVAFIPQTLIIDEDGNFLGRNLSFEELTNLVSEILD